ncbi:MAG: hypothetical protein K5886_02005 [Lachnospiraceae bacterium]|nr:hypothetical protein [Lachnospiraceae bacterium]
MSRTKSYFYALNLLVMILSSVLMLVMIVRGGALSMLLMEKHKKLDASECLKETEGKLIGLINTELKETAEEEYEPILNMLRNSEELYGNTEACALFYERYARALYGSFDEDNIGSTISGYLKTLSGDDEAVGNIRLNGTPVFDIKHDKDGSITGCSINRLRLEYAEGGEVITAARYDSNLDYPRAYFTSGSDGLFDYSLVAMKGLYIMGDTSSVIGNVYAGSHSRDERRGAEGMYGEVGRYGGINILSTQIAFNSEKVISLSDINIKSSYVVFGTESEPVRIFGQAINEIEGYNLDNVVNLNGEFSDDLKDAELLSEKQSILSDTEGLLSLYDYYDSDNDSDYGGPFRKILSNYDVILSDDFTGVVITSGNVIIEPDTNVEGSIIALDRIYVRGNNNLVANRDIAAALIDYERDGAGNEAGNRAENEVRADTYEDEAVISHDIMDYIKNIQYQGLFMQDGG